MGGVYHITMLVSGEQEDAIRLLFRDKNWPCWVKVLSDENVAGLIQGGYTDVFPTMGEDYSNTSVFTEIKSEVVDVDLHDDDDRHSDNDESLNTSKDIKSSFTDDDDDTMDYDMAQDKLAGNITDIKTEEPEDDDTVATGKLKPRLTRGGRKSRTENRLKCALCDTYCVTRTILKRHCKRRHKGMWLEFECKDCAEKFKTKEELWEHRRNANHEPRKALTSTSKELHSPEELVAMGHIKCDICSNFYPHKRSLRRHMYKVHRDVLPKWTCAVCGAEFDTRDALWKHKRQSQHKTSLWTLGNYQCDSCGKIYNRYDSFREHKLSCKTDGKEAEGIKDFPCDICGLVFKSMLRVKSHKRGVHVVAPVVCHVCGAMCKNKRALLVHRRRHDMKNKKFACDDCGKSFFNNTLLTQHIRTHTKEKPYKCPMCNYRCAIKQNIHKHSQKVHKTVAKAVDLSADGVKDENAETDTDMANTALDLSEDTHNTSMEEHSLTVPEPDPKPYDSKPYDNKPYDSKPYDTKPYDTKSYDSTQLPDIRYTMSEFQKYAAGRRELFGVDKMLGGKDERELQALQSLGALSEAVHDLRSPNLGGLGEGVHGLRSTNLGGHSEGVHGLRSPNLGGLSEGVHGLRSTNLGAQSEGVHGLRSPNLGAQSEGVHDLRSPNLGGLGDGVPDLRSPILGAHNEGVHDLRSPSVRQAEVDHRRPIEPENLHTPSSSHHMSTKDKYPSAPYGSAYINELQDLRMPSAIRSTDNAASDESRKNYMPPNLSNYPSLSDLSFSPRSNSNNETNPYKYNWGASTSK